MSALLLLLAMPTVVVAPKAEVRGKIVRLGEVARLRGFSPAAKAKAAKLTLGKAPAPGQGRLLTKAWLRVKLAEALPGVRLKLPARLEVVRGSRLVKGESLRKRVIAAARGSSASAIASMSVQRVPDMLVPTNAEVHVAFDGKVGRIAVKDGAEVIQRRQVSVRVDRMVPAWVSKEAHRRGHRLSKDDLELVELPASKVPSDAITGEDGIEGAIVRRALKPGRALRAGSLDLPAMVERGARVRMIARRGTIELTARGEALQKGRRGEQVQVRNLGSRKVVQGRVVAPNTIVMEF